MPILSTGAQGEHALTGDQLAQAIAILHNTYSDQEHDMGERIRHRLAQNAQQAVSKFTVMAHTDDQGKVLTAAAHEVRNTEKAGVIAQYIYQPTDDKGHAGLKRDPQLDTAALHSINQVGKDFGNPKPVIFAEMDQSQSHDWKNEGWRPVQEGASLQNGQTVPAWAENWKLAVKQVGKDAASVSGDALLAAVDQQRLFVTDTPPDRKMSEATRTEYSADVYDVVAGQNVALDPPLKLRSAVATRNV